MIQPMFDLKSLKGNFKMWSLTKQIYFCTKIFNAHDKTVNVMYIHYLTFLANTEVLSLTATLYNIAPNKEQK